MKKVLVLTGAGISAESGIKTFRDSNGLWENHNVMDVASLSGWRKNPRLVLDFYNQRRRQLKEVKPNDGHISLVALEEKFQVNIVTQNVDDLHERAGSKNIMHLHGELYKAKPDSPYYDDNRSCVWTEDMEVGMKFPETSLQIRPDIVWFGESVKGINDAFELAKDCDILIIVGTSMQVEPAASIHYFAKPDCVKYFINKDEAYSVDKLKNFFIRTGSASELVPAVVKELLEAH